MTVVLAASILLNLATLSWLVAASRRRRRRDDAGAGREGAADRLRFEAQLLSSVQESVFATDLAGTIVYWGNGAESLYGHRADEVMGRNLASVLPQGPESAPPLSRALETGSWSGQTLQRHKDGGTVWVDTFVSLVRDESGRPRGLVGIDRDITARKQAQEALQHTTNQLALMLDAMPVIAYRCRVDGVFTPTFLSRNIRDVTGYAADAFTTDPGLWLARVHPEDIVAFEASLARLVDHGYVECEYRWLVADGRERWFFDAARLVTDADGEASHVVGICRDITERKQIEETLRRRGERERLLFRELDHRVRNNLCSLLTLIDITAASAHDVDGFASAIRGRVEAMATVHGLLSKSSWSSTSLRDLASALIPVAARGAIDISGDDVAVPSNQAASLGMVLHELITNSLKHGALGTDGARTSLTCRVHRASDGPGRGREARVAIRWHETGVPLVEMKPVPGLGTALIDGLVRTDLRGEARLRYQGTGVDHDLRLVLCNDDEALSAVGRPAATAGGGSGSPSS
jgi:PAS domain S-box-containing protein